MKNVLILDTETTGLISNRTIPLDKQPEVIEFYGCNVDLETDEMNWELDYLIRNKLGPLSSEITRITGLTDADLIDKPFFEVGAPLLRAAIEGSDCVIAHNASYDREMIDMEFQRLGIKIAWPKVLCTVEETLHYKGHRLKLAALYAHLFGDTFPGAHRARNDVAALRRCCIELFKRGDL
jgi:DNA polymerase III epsilon subunit-like protein